MANKFTVFQKLNKILGNELESPKYVIDPQTFKNIDDRELDIKKLEAQQIIYLQNQWKKIDNELYQKAVYYEPTRIASCYDYEAMEFSIIGDTKIATPDGFITIKELADKGRDNEFIVYAYDHNKNKVVPAIARNAHYTRDEMTYKIIFDDDSFIVATYGHRFLKRDGVFCEVENLKIGDSMMPFYRKSFYNNDKYNWVYTCNPNEGHNGWVSEHNLIAEWYYDQKINDDEEVHHIDFNGKNNNPENLKIWNISEHRAYHARLNNEKLWKNDAYRAKMLEISKRTDNKHKWNGARKNKNNPSYKDINISEVIAYAKEYKVMEQVSNVSAISVPKLQRVIKEAGYSNWNDFLRKNDIIKDRKIPVNNIPWDTFINYAKKYKTIQATAFNLKISLKKLYSIIKASGFDSWSTFLLAYGIEVNKKETIVNDNVVNHKIKSIEPYGVEPVYDLTVPGYKNFATDTIFSHNTPEIAAAMDIFAEEATTPNENGNILTIYSESDRIKEELTDLFENVIDINSVITSWARNLVKYGDNFIYNKVIPGKGIVGVTQLPNIEITRAEPGFSKVMSLDDFQKEKNVKFFWKNKELDFNSFEISHFRLLGDDRRLPYGTSMLEKVRRIWKQLLLAEDAMLVYRVTRAPERRVYKVYVGNMDDKDIDAYVDKVANNFKRSNITNSSNGQQDTRYNAMPIHKDTPIPLLDGRIISIEELAKEYDNGKENWVYSIQDYTHKPVPGKVIWCGKNYTANKLIKVWLDDNTWVTTAPEHPFILRDGTQIRADKLTPDMSLMPFNGSLEPINEGKLVKIIEEVNEISDVYCMTVVGINNEEDRHNFAILSKNLDNSLNTSGLYIKNSVDQDFFIPTRDPALPMPIETLPGANNLGEIADIQYIQNKLLAALRIPKTFLGFDQAVGDGKNLSILDIRFARAVNKIQRSIIQELNKMAIIHLYVKGYEDDLNNFTISLTNPSTQAEMLKVTNWKEKIALYKEAVMDMGNGFGPISQTRAKKEILGWSDDEIKLDIQRQAVENAATQELKMLGETIKQTGIFRDLYQLYKIDPNNMAQNQAMNQQPDQQITPGGGIGGDVAQDFTAPLNDEPGATPPAGEPGSITPPDTEPNTNGTPMLGSEEEQNNLQEKIIKQTLLNPRKIINENISKTLDEINRILNK